MSRPRMQLDLSGLSKERPVLSPEEAESKWGEKVDNALRDVFHLSAFRPNQREAILALLSGRDVFLLMPTGGGKSLCFWLPAIVKQGVAIIISPLIALIENQVSALKNLGIAAACLNSQQNKGEKDKILMDLKLKKPNTRMLFVTPELISTESFRTILRQLNRGRLVTLFATDEAHCVSTWGHDFRPKFRMLKELKVLFPNIPMCAVTATATTRVRKDIVESLDLKQPAEFITSFDRPNIHYSVRQKAHITDVVEDMVQLIRNCGTEIETSEATGASKKKAGSGAGFVSSKLYQSKLSFGDQEISDKDVQSESLTDTAKRDASGLPCGIIYCQKKATCDMLATELNTRGLVCQSYHGTLSATERTRIQREWQSGQCPIIVCTIAFGMGIDKPDVRIVVHESVGGSMESTLILPACCVLRNAPF
eukprot:TRINITY_DN6590_c0_g1_i4.p1 TRINITY_DN6590_c0_g1~~TRINITY_DN6590_c0_g1_i4.p1  ORF type:complete len:423 (+),score=42.56 TRINITY_DN6590_c0_g1_i4:240-1508(+)